MAKYADLKRENAELRAAIIAFVDADDRAFIQHVVDPNDPEPGGRLAAAVAALRRLVGRELDREATK